MPTTHVPEFRCGTAHSGWLMTAHPTVEDGEAPGEVCFTKKRGPGCKKNQNHFNSELWILLYLQTW